MSLQPVALFAGLFCALIAVVMTKGVKSTITNGLFFLGSTLTFKQAGYQRDTQPIIFWFGVLSLIFGAVIAWIFAIGCMLAGLGIWN